MHVHDLMNFDVSKVNRRGMHSLVLHALTGVAVSLT